jgi:hypothetical protein
MGQALEMNNRQELDAMPLSATGVVTRAVVYKHHASGRYGSHWWDVENRPRHRPLLPARRLCAGLSPVRGARVPL